MSLAFNEEHQQQLHHTQYDLVITTSMTDVAGLKAFCPNLGNIPWLLYFHENQFAYPASRYQQGELEMQMVTLYSALAADVCVFNSAFNMNTFLQGVQALLKKLPDQVPAGLLDILISKSQVLSVPVDVPNSVSLSPSRVSDLPPLVLCWNHRWEYDKGPDLLLALLRRLEAIGVDYRLHLVGQSFRKTPDEFNVIQQLFGNRLLQVGYLPDKETYWQCLGESHVVLSTSWHDFQGLSVLEGILAGCMPIVPNRLAYPELIGGDMCIKAEKQGDIDCEADAMALAIRALQQEKAIRCPDIQHLSAKHLIPQYQALLAKLVNT